jgi:pyruvate dehydrogenase (quinone)/pyruvate oxidase
MCRREGKGVRSWKTIIVASQGALGATDELEQLADLMAAPIVKPLLGKATAPS